RPFQRAGAQTTAELLSNPAWPEGHRRGTQGARRKHGHGRDLGGKVFPGRYQQDARRDEKAWTRSLAWPSTTSISLSSEVGQGEYARRASPPNMEPASWSPRNTGSAAPARSAEERPRSF